ncbi:2-oxo-4-hydroxy-4-carboxy-5-ureidoimidazoline decarboxylase [Streptomyces sp. TRM43335]|uniref:2-oxo-4-hydroxy-4-carboxy-5-ureidoimidazoline decarboxylase n=2 Tax=Streptomyces taklimakanensis TaxID=2569853 RepID=A0A6G2BEM1_9ACTN|nr:2-oxo-4-hydroxy-4-carboxy-5-ureidoimidazoline decarboxylase [Streptomyces taklimakanensis]MTE20690.1 2-oxo-4-hydroxy-4-carboxy-5-ureidoimidazoline decarboxylase [Streptomyces taklimakanensis]
MRLPPQRSEATPLHRLNSASPDELRETLLSCCGSRRWADSIVEHRPYPDPEALLAAADEAGYDLTDEDLSEALSRESSAGPDHGGLLYGGHRLTISGPGTLAAHTALRAAHAAYESRFGYAFVLCVDDVREEEAVGHVLTAIRTRLGNEADRERAVAADELRRIARGRLVRLLREGRFTGSGGGPGSAERPEAPKAPRAPAAVPRGLVPRGPAS